MMTSAACHRVVPFAFILALAAGCAPKGPSPTVNLNDGRQHFTRDHVRASAVCDGRLFEVDADRASLRVTGPCRQVFVAGNHNDIETDVLAGGVVEVVGAHNDITWNQVGRGPRPALLDHGRSNSFHRGNGRGDESS